MRAQKFIATNAVILAAIFICGCSKKNPSGQTQQKSEIFSKMFPNESLPAKITYLGEFELSTKTPSHVTIDVTNDCTITPSALPDGSLQLDIVVESKASGQKPAHVQMLVHPNQQFAFQTADMTTPVGFKTKLKAE